LAPATWQPGSWPTATSKSTAREEAAWRPSRAASSCAPPPVPSPRLATGSGHRGHKLSEPGAQRLLVEPEVAPIGDRAEAALERPEPVVDASGHDPERLARAARDVEEPVDRGQVVGVVELAGDPERRRQVEVADPEDVDALDCRNLVRLLDPRRSLDLRDHEQLAVDLLHRRSDAALDPVVPVKDADAAPAERRVAG